MKKNLSDLTVFPGYTKPQLASIRKAAPEMYEALKAIAPDVIGWASNQQEARRVRLVTKALASAEGREE